MNTEISKAAKRIILDLWDIHGLEMAIEVSSRSKASLYRWRNELTPQLPKNFIMPRTFEELEALKYTPMLDLVPDEVIDKILTEHKAKGGELK